MIYLLIIGLGLLAGWAVNGIANTLPYGKAPWQDWLSPLAQLAQTIQMRSRVIGQAENALPYRPVRHLLVWVFALGLGWLAYVQMGWSVKSFFLALEAWFFLAVAVIDLEHRKVLNRMLLPVLPVLALFHLWAGLPNLVSALLGATLGFGLFLLLALIKPGSIGMGDVKLAGLIGFAAGLPGGIIALIVGIYSGGLAAIAILIYHRFRRRQTMAYAPYLVLGAWIALYFGAELWHLYLHV
jgi:prepilin signal peptidase PulO-like enzyme (type II secretory pathway)